MMPKKNKLSYSELLTHETFLDRFNYLKQTGVVGDTTFAGSRILNQQLYSSQEWKRIKRDVIIRDNGCDLGCQDRPIAGAIYVHHINPITPEDILERRPNVLDPDNLICVSFDTHQAIHFGDENNLHLDARERRPNDTCPWKK